MNKSIDLLNKLKDIYKSDYKISKILGVSRQSISKCRKTGKISNKLALRIAEVLDYDKEITLLIANIDRSKETETKKIFEKIKNEINKTV